MPAAQAASSPAPAAKPDLMLAPSTSAAEPAGPMGGMRLLDDLDRRAPSPEPVRAGHWVIAPLPFRNELLGAGLVLGAGYLYGPRNADSKARHSVAALAGMYAEGGTQAVMGGHRGYWSDQRYRTTLGVADGKLHYDVELDLGERNHTLSLAQKLAGFSADLAMKLGTSGWLGAGLVYGNTDVRLSDPQAPLPDDFQPATRIDVANVRLSGELDSRDSDLYPRTGRYARTQLLIARQELGSDDDYEALELEWNGYLPLDAAQVLAWRVAGKIVDGGTPFFAMAWFGSGADLRGYTPGRYIGESMLAAQMEWRWQATPRWGLVTFAGVGKVAGALGEIDTDAWLPAAGLGVRLRLSKSLPLNLRADFAWGHDDGTFTLAVGEAF